ncbi:TPA: ATP-binding cassette domain-containing protein [Streptococcus pneumoniae]|nr:peptide ABC transporter ATPase [Streptococcus pneumoniae]VIZ62920.1 peptide ABC transporter ATPase [Streptococcus pneumoniae]HES9513774.1 ATP-binding cassette domain-containing protein [Streptococcus pneumoniae]
MIRAEKLCLRIKEKTIFENMSFYIEKPQMVAITGVSGSGKTSLLNCMGLIKDVSSGKIYINNKDCTCLQEKDKISFWENTATFIFQDYGIIDEESVLYNITFSNKKSNQNKAKDYLEKVGLKEKANNIASTLSGGEKQRLGIARALYKKAKIIFADEPTASLDEKNRNIIINLLRECVNNGILVVVATHDDRLSQSCDKIISM